MSATNKPVRPEGFPLYAHASGRWAKEIAGRTYYFDTWDRPNEALAKYLQEKDYLKSGIRPPLQNAITVLEVLDRFLEARKRDVESGELTQRTWDDYRKTCKLITPKFGGLAIEHLLPDDYAKIREHLGKGVGPSTLGRRIREAKVGLRYLISINGKTPNFGTAFRQPSAKTQRKAKAASGSKLYSPSQIKAFIDATDNVQVKAMILMGINCAFGNKDCASIKWRDIDLVNGWHTFARPKTGVERRAKLWPETIAALKLVKTPKSGLVFRTRFGNAWIQEPTTEGATRIDSIAQECFKMKLAFYNLRRTFRTIADELGETLATRYIMGHAPNNMNMDHVYVQSIADARLAKVAQHVHDWLFG